MGEHKANPTAIAAKNGELPPKKKPMSKRDRERLLTAKVAEIVYNMPASRVLRNMGGDY